MRPGDTSAGTVHHIAFRVPSDDEREWRERLVDAGFNVIPVIDRLYFRSIHFREPAGIPFEIATNRSGFTTDEDAADLGTELKLPPWLELRRETIKASPPVLPVPRRVRADRG